jgi:two-component system, NtrC family, sensor kinase
MLSLNLREKVLASLFSYLLIYLIFGSVIFANFAKFNEYVTLLIRSVKLGNICLEIRRYEKNYIISKDLGDYQTTKKYIGEALDYANIIVSDLKDTAPPLLLHRLQTRLREYSEVFSDFRIDPAAILSENLPEQTRTTIREQGKELIEISNDLISYEQETLKQFVAESKLPIVVASLFLGVFTTVLAVLLSRKLITSLKSLESAAETIAKGTFLPLTLPKQKDEIYSVKRAFNLMVEELEQRQSHLLQAQKLSSIGTLTSGIAHQLNNPLNNISTSCQIAVSGLDKQDLPGVARMLSNISDETRRAAGIVRDLLEFSRDKNFFIHPTNVADVVDHVVSLAAISIPEGIRLNKDAPSDLIVDIDPQKITEALLNLVLNAIKAISVPPGGTISISATADRMKDEAVIVVADNGCGIAPEHLDNIFEPFYTTKEIGEGTGLGLAVVSGIINKHKGNISVQSTLGTGSSFVITLPLHAGPIPDDKE